MIDELEDATPVILPQFCYVISYTLWDKYDKTGKEAIKRATEYFKQTNKKQNLKTNSNQQNKEAILCRPDIYIARVEKDW